MQNVKKNGQGALVKKVLASAREHNMFPPAAPVLCALSGGADSVALLGALRELRETLGLGGLAAAHFNHRLRGVASDADEDFVRSLCREWDVTLYAGGTDVAAEAGRRRSGVEETARDLRYGFLRQTASQEGFTRVATGHTADDNVETVLLHLARGAGLSGLTGIPPVRGDIVRPLLSCTRADVEAFLTARGLAHIEDATNLDLSLARNRIRHRVVPELRALNPRLHDAVCGLTTRLRQDEIYLSQQAERELRDLTELAQGVSFSARRLSVLPPALAARVCGHMYAAAAKRDHAALSSVHVEAILALCAARRPSASLNLPGGLTARRDYDKLVLALPIPAPPPFTPFTLKTGAVYQLPIVNCQLSIVNCLSAARSTPNHFFIAPASTRGGLTARARRAGDRLTLPGKPGGKSLKKLMIDAKIPIRLRDVWPVIADENGPMAVPGLGVDASHRAAPGTTALEIVFDLDPRKSE